METFFGFDEESVDSETLSETSYNTDRTDRTPATPEEDLDEVSSMLGTSHLCVGQGCFLSGVSPAVPYQSPRAGKAGLCCLEGNQ